MPQSKEEHATYQREYYKTHSKECKAYTKKWTEDHWDRFLQLHSKWKRKNSSKVSAMNKAYRDRIKVTLNNIDEILILLPKE